MVAGILSAGMAAAETGAWQSRCEGDYCAFRKTLVYADSNETFALLEVLIAVDNGESAFIVTAPLGVSLEPGLRILTAGAEWRVPFKTCLADGCRATVKLAQPELSLLLENDSIEIRYIKFGETRPVSAELPLDGLVASISNGSR